VESPGSSDDGYVVGEKLTTVARRLEQIVPTGPFNQLIAQSQAAADAARHLHQLGLYSVAERLQPSPIVSITRELARIQELERCAASLDPVKIANELTAGETISEVALRYALTLSASLEVTQAEANDNTRAIVDVLHNELSLPSRLAEKAAVSFVFVHLLLHWVVHIQDNFDQSTISSDLSHMAVDRSSVARFARSFWTQPGKPSIC